MANQIVQFFQTCQIWSSAEESYTKNTIFGNFPLAASVKTPGGRRVRLGGVEWAGCWASCARGFGYVKKRARLANWAMLGHDKWAREESCWAVQDNRKGKKRKGHGPALRIQPKRLVRKEIPF
jgi:hypothetical protein